MNTSLPQWEEWEFAARVAMGDRGIGYADASPLIEDAEAHYKQGGREPWETLGSPVEFAVAAAAERPPSERAGRDTGGMTPGDHLTGALFALACMTILATLWAALSRGMTSIPLTPAGLTGFALLAVTMIVMGGGLDAVRAAGHPRRAPWVFAAGAAMVVVTGVAFTELPKTHIGSVPVIVVVSVAAVVAWLLTRSGKPGNPTDVPSTGAHGSIDTDASIAPDASIAAEAGLGGESWFNRLGGLLIGRFDVPPERAKELVEEARLHLSASGGSPAHEFGPVDEYALALADNEATRRGPWWRGPTAELISMSVGAWLAADLAKDSWDKGRIGIAIAAAAIALGGAWLVSRTALRRFREWRAQP